MITLLDSWKRIEHVFLSVSHRAVPDNPTDDTSIVEPHEPCRKSCDSRRWRGPGFLWALMLLEYRRRTLKENCVIMKQ